MSEKQQTFVILDDNFISPPDKVMLVEKWANVAIGGDGGTARREYVSERRTRVAFYQRVGETFTVTDDQLKSLQDALSDNGDVPSPGTVLSTTRTDDESGDA